jgi:hypothetical protein
MAVQQQQHMDVVGCCMFFSRLISMFIFNILQFPSRCNQIVSRCIAPTCTALATGCTSQKTLIFIVTFWRTSNLTSKALPPSSDSHLRTTFCSNKRLASFRMNATANYFMLPGRHIIILAHWTSICYIHLWHFQELLG